MNRLKPRLSYSNVMVTILAVVVLGGGIANAASQLGKNTVGPKQLKKNAVTTAKVKREAITAAKVKKGTLTGTQINLSTLGTVPTAQTANVANSVAPAEAWHEVGAPGEPGFANGWKNAGGAGPTAAFYKDHEGIVHLRGFVKSGAGPIFNLPPGYRPASGKAIGVAIFCEGGGCSSGVGVGAVYGSGLKPSLDGAVQIAGTTGSLNGIDFRAEG